MIQRHTLSLPRPTLDADAVGPLRFGRLGGRRVLTNEYGEWHLLDDDAFSHLLAGTLSADHESRPALASKGFLRSEVDAEALASAMRRRKKHVGVGPSHHHLLLTDVAGSMSVETAKAVLDHAMLSTSSALTFVLHADPMSGPDLDLLGFLHQYGTEKNRYEGKTLRWILRAPLSSLGGELPAWLADHRFVVEAPIGGVDEAAAQAEVAQALVSAAEKRHRQGEILQPRVPLSAAKDDPAALVAALKALGATRVTLFDDGALPAVEAADTWRAFAEAARAAGDLVEQTVATVIEAASRTDATGEPSLHSPFLAQLAYDPAGRIVAGPSALSLEGDDFVLGQAGESSYKDVVHHPVRRALALASLIECLPGLSDHWAAPYLGVDPVETWLATGDMFPRLPSHPRLQRAIALAEAVVTLLSSEDVAAVEAWRTWPA